MFLAKKTDHSSDTKTINPFPDRVTKNIKLNWSLFFKQSILRKPLINIGITTASGSTLGKVSSCTLLNATKIEVQGRKYCAVSTGPKTQSQSINYCKALNARLPLPKSNPESNAFFVKFRSRTWIDITDPVRGKDFCY